MWGWPVPTQRKAKTKIWRLRVCGLGFFAFFKGKTSFSPFKLMILLDCVYKLCNQPNSACAPSVAELKQERKAACLRRHVRTKRFGRVAWLWIVMVVFSGAYSLTHATATAMDEPTWQSERKGYFLMPRWMIEVCANLHDLLFTPGSLI